MCEWRCLLVGFDEVFVFVDVELVVDVVDCVDDLFLVVEFCFELLYMYVDGVGIVEVVVVLYFVE